MVVNAGKYNHCKDAKSYLSLEPSYKDACVESGKNDAYLNVWMMVVLASVIGRLVRSMYPPCNGTEGSNSFIYRNLNATFQTDKGSEAAQPIYIMWTSTIECPKGLWSPNHFVSCLAPTDVPGIPCKEDILLPKQTEETNFSTSSQSYNQNFPDLSSSLEFSNSPKRRKLSRSVSKNIRQKQSVNNNLCEVEAKQLVMTSTALRSILQTTTKMNDQA